MPTDPQLAARFATMSPALVRDLLVGHARLVRGAEAPLLDATRDTPNWQQRDVQLAWHVLGLYCDYVYGVVGDPGNVRLLPPVNEIDHEASFNRFTEGLMDLRESLAIGADFLSELWPYLSRKVLPGRSESEVIALFTRAMTGASCAYPATLDFVPPILLHYLAPRLLGGDLMLTAEFAVHLTAGASDGYVQVARTLARNGLLGAGDRVALGPVPDPALAELFGEQAASAIVPLTTAEPDDLRALADPAVKLLVLTGGAAALPPAALAPVLDARPELLVLADCSEVVAPATPTRTVLARWPRQALGLYSFSRAFGLAGARLGVVLAHRECVADRLLRELPAARREANERRYAGCLPRPGEAGFLARLVEESAGVAFGQQGGLPTPSQVLLALCASYEAVSPGLAEGYAAWVREELRRRHEALRDGLEVDATVCGPTTPEGGTVVLEVAGLAAALGAEVASGLRACDPWALLFHLAHHEGLIVQPGPSGAGALQLSVLGLGEVECRRLGQTLAAALRAAAQEGACEECIALLSGPREDTGRSVPPHRTH